MPAMRGDSDLEYIDDDGMSSLARGGKKKNQNKRRRLMNVMAD